MDYTSYILPYPYAAYTMHNRSEDFSSYKDKIFGWVKENTSSTSIDRFAESAFPLLRKSDDNQKIEQWILDHSDKIVVIPDFSGLAFGIQIMEAYEEIGVRFPIEIDEQDKQLYPGYNEEEFKVMSTIERLDWMYGHCEFVPIRTIYEDIHDGYSHKFSHIKRDMFSMDLLKPYLENVQYQPNDNVYYYIEFNPRTAEHYLRRDHVSSPTRNRREDN